MATPPKKPHYIVCLVVAMASCQLQPPPPSAAPLQAVTVSQPLLVPIVHEGRELYQDIEGFSYCRSGHREQGPRGIVFDGASVPRALWFFMPPDGSHRREAYIHDMAYCYKGELPDGCRVTRAEADTDFYNGLIKVGFSRARAGLAYRGVRLGGWLAWRRSSGQPLILPVQPRMASARRPRTIFSHIFAP